MKTVAWMSLSFLIVASGGCSRPLPDDLPSLMSAMESSDVITSMNATVKVWRQFGKEGLFEVLRRGGPGARGRAAFRLQSCHDADCEAALLRVLSGDADAFVRRQAAISLRVVGTEVALGSLAAASHDQDASVATLSAEAVTAIRERIASASKKE